MEGPPVPPESSLHTFVHESLWGSGDRAAHLPASCPDLRVCLPVWTGASWDFAPEIQREGRNVSLETTFLPCLSFLGADMAAHSYPQCLLCPSRCWQDSM